MNPNFHTRISNDSRFLILKLKSEAVDLILRGKFGVIDLLSDGKGDVRAFPAKTSWGTTRPLICQAVNKIIPALLPWAAWPIRGLVVPHEVLAGNALTAPFPKMD